MTIKRCVECVLVESLPDIIVGDDGVCNVCKNYQVNAENDEPEYLETDFLKIIEKHKGKGRYDCLCMLSGGKDSTASLYYIKEKYKMNPLVFTFNHGFVPKEHIDSAKKNCRETGSRLDLL